METYEICFTLQGVIRLNGNSAREVNRKFNSMSFKEIMSLMKEDETLLEDIYSIEKVNNN